MHDDKALYVLFSPSEHITDGESGFWSNMGGWGCINDADRFNTNETSDYMKTMSVAMDAEWVPLTVAVAMMRMNGRGSHNIEKPSPEPTMPGGKIGVYVCTDGITYSPALSGVRIIITGLESEDGSPCELHVNATDEGIIADVWSLSVSESEHLGTRAEQYQDIVIEVAN